MKKRRNANRVLSLLLVMALLITGMPVSVHATGDMETPVVEAGEILSGTGQEAEISETEIPTVIEAGTTYTLTEDIVFTEGQTFERIAGTLDGNGHTITLADKPLANEVTGTIQNLGVTSENVIVSDKTFGSMAITLSGTIQNCYSTAKIRLTGFTGEVGGLVGTFRSGAIKNTYFGGSINAMMAGGLVGIRETEESILSNSYYATDKASSALGPVSWGKKPEDGKNSKKTLEELKSAVQLLNKDIPDTGFTWTSSSDGSNQGLPVLTQGGVSPEPEQIDKTALQNAVNEGKRLEQDRYTEKSWKAFSEALDVAEQVLQKSDVKQTEIEEALKALNVAKEQLEKKKVTEPVAPPKDENQVVHIKKQADLEKIDAEKTDVYYVLDNDITLDKKYKAFFEFNATFDGNGHTVTFEDTTWLFQSVGEQGILQNTHFTGTLASWAESGPAGYDLKGAIINCYTDVKGDGACGFAKRLTGGRLINSYSISEGKIAVLFKEYKGGNLINSYWSDSGKNPVQFPAEALINSSAKSEDDMKTKEFVELLNKNKGEFGIAWGQNSTGYPYFGENQEYNPNKPNFPENKYEIEFAFADGVTETIENQTLYVSPDEVGAFNLAGTFHLKELPTTSTVSWNITDVKPDRALSIGADRGELRVDAEGSAIVSATERKADASTETVAWVKVIAKSQIIEQIKLFIDGEDVTNGKIKVEGSEWKNIQVQAKYQGSEEFIPVHSSRFTYAPSDGKLIYNLNSSSEFKFNKPGTASMTVTAKANPEIKAEVEATSSYVPVESVKPAISGEKEIHSRNANDPDNYAFLPDYSGVIVSPENASYASNWTVTSSAPSIANYVDSMVKGYVPYKAGTVTYTAKIEQTNPETKKTSVVSGTSEVTYKYKNPLTKITIDESNLQMENFTEQLLNLTFEGELSKDGWSVTDPQLEWSYDKAGIVKVVRKEQGYWKKGNPEWDNAPDKGSFLTSDKYYVQSLKEGTVTVTGTPIDKTNKVEPIKFTVTVSGGETPQVDIDALINKGLQGAKEQFASKYPEENYQYNNNDWIVYARLRAGETISQEKLDAYYQSVADTVKKWSKMQKPTDMERVALSLLIMNKDITDVAGVNLAEMIYNHPSLDMGGNELAWALLAADAKGMEIPTDAKWNRESIITALLKFQNEENGGFGLMDNQTVSVDMTAMCLQALAPYRNTNVKVHQAVEAGLEYLKNSMSDSYDFGTSESTAQVLLTLTILGINPLNSDFGTPYSNMITCLMDNYYCETEKGNGFCHDKSNKKLNEMSGVQVFQAFTAYTQAKAGEKTYWDLTEENQKTEVEEVIQLIENLPAIKDLTLEDAEVVLSIQALYESLTEDEQKLVHNVEKLQKAIERIEELKTLGEEVGKVTLTIMDGLKKEEKLLSLLEENEIKGMMIQTQATIYQTDSMMSVIERACKENGLSISIRNGEYIEAIDGLGEFDRGPGSGWVGTLNDEFTKTGFADFTVENGKLKDKDVITVEYTENLGKDVTENAELSTLGITDGKLSPEYARDTYEYTLSVGEKVKEITLNPKSYNRYAETVIKSADKVYESGQAIPVEDGTKIEIVSKKTVRGEDIKTYLLTIEQKKTSQPEPQPEPNPEPNPNPDEQKEITLVNKKYGVSLKGKGLEQDMELLVTPLDKDSEAVKAMRKEIPSAKSVFRLYDVVIRQNGKNLELPKEAVLSIPVGEKYNGQQLTVLHYIDGKVEKLNGKSADDMVSVSVKSLGGFGVVVDTPSNSQGNNQSGNQSNGSNGGVKTGDEAQLMLWMCIGVISLGTITALYRRKKNIK